MQTGRLFMLLGATLALISVERLVNASLISFAPDNSLSLRLGISFLCGGLAPIVFGIGYFWAAQAKEPPREDPPAIDLQPPPLM